MSKKKTIIIVSIIVIVLLGFLTFSMFGIYKAEMYPYGDKSLIVKKVANENCIFSFLNPQPENVLQTDDLIVHKNPMLFDQSFRQKENFCSRVIGMPGDIVSIRESQVFVNDVAIDADYDLWFLFRVSSDESQNFEKLLDGIQFELLKTLNSSKACNIITTSQQAQEIRKIDGIVNVRKIINSPDVNKIEMFSSKGNSPLWNPDNMGPIMVPEQDVTVFFNPRNIGIYKYIIESHENNLLEYNINNVKVNGQETESYVIKQNYFFVLNDNRFNRDDSRVWGFIPANQIVGKVMN